MIDVVELGLPEVTHTSETKLGAVHHLGNCGMVLLENPPSSESRAVILHYGVTTHSVQDFAREAGSLPGDNEPDDGEGH